jgi:hypothetical protein
MAAQSVSLSSSKEGRMSHCIAVTAIRDADDMLAVSIMMKTIKIKTLLEVLLRDASG